MNRIRLALVAFLALATGAIAADRREERPATGFHAVAMAINMNLEVIQDGTESLTLEGDPDVLAEVETFVRDGTLDFRYRRDSRMRSHKRINAVVHARDMDAIALSGSGNLRSRALNTAISGAGTVRYYGDPTVAKAVRGIGHIERVAANP